MTQLQVFMRKAIRKIKLTLAKNYFGTDSQKIRNILIEGFDIIAPVNEVVGRHFYALREYEKEETEFLKKAIKPDDVCLDVGANVGYFSLLMSKIAHQGSIHSFEPIKFNAALIKASAEMNGIDNITINRCAVGDRVGSVTFSVSLDSAYSSIHDTGRSKEAEQNEVPLISIDHYIASMNVERVDMMKVDVEGAEGLVIDGATNLFASDTRPRIVLIELVEENMAAFHSSPQQVFEKMIEFGYSPHVVVDLIGTIRKCELFEVGKIYNFIFIDTMKT